MPASDALYLDHASTTPQRPEVTEAIAAAQAEAFANPSSQHAAGRHAKRILEEARERILACLGARATGSDRDRLVFTSGASEANRLAILGVGRGPAGAVATSARDHSSLRLAAAALAPRGWSHATLPLDHAGRIDRAAVAAWLRDASALPTRLLATTLVCGQTGSHDDLASLASALDATTLVHADATQAILTTDLSFATLPLSSLTLAPHKFGGPRGIGAAVIRGGLTLDPLLPGTQEMGLRAGTEAVALAVGFARSLELAVAERAAAVARLSAVRERFERGVLAAVGPAAARVIAADAERSPHISTIAFPGRDRQAIVMAADLAGLCCATGSACSSGSSEPAPALAAMGLAAEIVRGAVRFSFGRETTSDDIDRAIRILHDALR